MKTHTIFSSVKGWVRTMVKRQGSEGRIIYSINVEDIQTVADEVLKRPLTEAEIAKIEDAVGENISWFDAIEQAMIDNKLV